jgi:hypothetical protein
MRIIGLKEEEMTEASRKMHNEGLHNPPHRPDDGRSKDI